MSIPVPLGGLRSALAERGGTAFLLTVSDDGRKIVAHRQPTPLLGSGADSEVWVLNADGSGGIQ